MLRLFREAPAARGKRSHRVVLCLESFEGRAAPSTVTFGSPSPASTTPPANVAPQIVEFTATEVGNGLYVITGRVIDENPGGLTIHFAGDVGSLSGKTVITNADGTFSLTAQLKTDGTDIGWLLATTTDAQGLRSNEASVYIHPTPR